MAEVITWSEDATPAAAAAAAAPISVEEVIEGSLGKMTWNQIVQAMLACIPPVFDNQQTLISVFTDAEPAWYCTNNNNNNCNSYSNICSLPTPDWNWVGNKNKTIISDWDLHCATSFVKGLPATCYFVGCLLSGFLVASLGDTSLGRKNLLLFSCLTMSLAGLASAFAPTFYCYCVFRFICGAARVSVSTSSFVLLSEKVGKKWRAQIVLLGCISLTLGILSLTGIAYLTQNESWRALYIATSTPGILFSVLIHFCLFESPRWLFLQGRHNQALTVLKRIGTMSHHLSSLVLAQDSLKIQQSNVNPFSSIMVIAKKRWALQRLLVTMGLSVGVGIMYFGIFLGVGSLGPNIYISSVFNAIIFLVSSLISYLFWIQTVNRRSSVLGFCTMSGATSIVSVIAGHDQKGIRVGLELTALFCACMVFNILFIYTVELFPTCVRNTAVSLSRQAMLFASIFVPILVVIGRRNDLFCDTVFGVTIIVCGLLVLTLPETRSKALCDSMEEQEVTIKDCGLCGCI